MILLAGCGPQGGGTDGATPADSTDALERKAEKGPVKLSVRVSPREPRLSDLVEMDVTVESQPDVLDQAAGVRAGCRRLPHSRLQ